MVSFSNLVLFLAALSTALMAGLFYSYSCSVNPGLSKLSDTEYLNAMQSINRAILNPAFFAAFMGSVVLLPLSAYLSYSSPQSIRFWLLAAAAVVYIIGLFGVTILGNVPLNEMLNALNISTASAGEIALMRDSFEGPWNRFHAIRTAAVVLSLVLVLAACIVHPGEKPAGY